MMDIFCKIVAEEIPSTRVLEDEDWIAIDDLHPQAPVHVLVIPRKHIDGIGALRGEDATLIGKLLLGVQQVTQKLGLDTSGYRVIINHGEHGGQTIGHLHIHVLGGKPLGPKIVHH